MRKMMKCKFLVETIGYLGQAIRLGRLAPVKRTIDDVGKYDNPTMQSELRFFGLCIVFKWSVPKLARLALFSQQDIVEGPI